MKLFGVVYIAISLLAAGAGTPALAKVDETDAGHLVLSYAISVKAAPAKAYAGVADIAHWWSAEHTYSGHAENLSLTAKAGGCFCEKLADGGSVQHLSVLLAMPGKLLRLGGALGPLQSGAVNGTLTFAFKPEQGGTSIGVTYVVSGFFAGGLDKLAAGVDGVLGAQIERLQRWIDTGTAAVPAKKS